MAEQDAVNLSPLALAVFQRMREEWQKELRDALRRLDPYAPQGRLSPQALPPGVVRATGDYNPLAVYRKGDLVRGSDGRDYYTLVAGSTGLEPSANPANFRAVEGWNPAHPHDGSGPEAGIKLAAGNTHEAVVVGPATGALHWDAAALTTLINALAGLIVADGADSVHLAARRLLRFGDGTVAAEGADGAVYYPSIIHDGTGTLIRVPVLDGSGGPVLDGAGHPVYAYAHPAGAAVVKYATTIGDGVATSIAVAHGLGTTDVVIAVYQAATPFQAVYPDLRIVDANTIACDFATAPTSGQYRVVVAG